MAQYVHKFEIPYAAIELPQVLTQEFRINQGPSRFDFLLTGFATGWMKLSFKFDFGTINCRLYMVSKHEDGEQRTVHRWHLMARTELRGMQDKKAEQFMLDAFASSDPPDIVNIGLVMAGTYWPKTRMGTLRFTNAYSR